MKGTEGALYVEGRCHLPWGADDTPIFTRLVGQADASRFPLHVPGHQQGRVLPAQLSHWLGAAARLDLTELPGLDNLHAATGCIAESQQLAAAHYQSGVCYYSVNGSSAGIVAAIAGCIGPGGKVLFLNPFHISAWRGLVYADARPVLPNVTFCRGVDRLPVPDITQVRQMLREFPDVDAVFVTSPTYRGEAAPVSEIAELAHEHGLPLIVDEAHGAHFGLHAELPPHSVACGADVVVQSVHKTLPGLTQTAWLHCTGALVDHEAIAEALRAVQSTSPSYLLLASLDLAQAWLRLEGRDAAERAMRILQPIAVAAEDAVHRDGQGVRVVLPNRDRFRHWVSARHLAHSAQLQERLAQQGYFVEYADATGVLSLFGFGVTTDVVSRYLETLDAWRRSVQDEAFHADGLTHAEATTSSQSGQIALRLTPREAAFAGWTWRAVEDSVGCTVARAIIPYPPGVPIAWPGQLLDGATAAAIRCLADSGTELQGLRPDGAMAVVR